MSGTGTGTVEAAWDGPVLVVLESGEWALEGGRPMRWQSSSRWHVEGDSLAVEHTRQDEPAQAVLEVGPDGVWRGQKPWLCGADAYSVEVFVGLEGVEVSWTIQGPKKASRTVTRYG